MTNNNELAVAVVDLMKRGIRISLPKKMKVFVGELYSEDITIEMLMEAQDRYRVSVADNKDAWTIIDALEYIIIDRKRERYFKIELEKLNDYLKLIEGIPSLGNIDPIAEKLGIGLANNVKDKQIYDEAVPVLNKLGHAIRERVKYLEMMKGLK